jgi:uncharacterized membrane protein
MKPQTQQSVNARAFVIWVAAALAAILTAGCGQDPAQDNSKRHHYATATAWGTTYTLRTDTATGASTLTSAGNPTLEFKAPPGALEKPAGTYQGAIAQQSRQNLIFTIIDTSTGQAWISSDGSYWEKR